MANCRFITLLSDFEKMPSCDGDAEDEEQAITSTPNLDDLWFVFKTARVQTPRNNAADWVFRCLVRSKFWSTGRVLEAGSCFQVNHHPGELRCPFCSLWLAPSHPVPVLWFDSSPFPLGIKSYYYQPSVQSHGGISILSAVHNYTVMVERNSIWRRHYQYLCHCWLHKLLILRSQGHIMQSYGQ